MNRSKILFELQEIDSKLDAAQKRIEEITRLLADKEELNEALENKQHFLGILTEKQKLMKKAEHNVEDQNLKLSQNQKKLYSGSVTNPKELEDLQREAESLQKYLEILEERQLEAMIALEHAQTDFDQAASQAEEISHQKEKQINQLNIEKIEIEKTIATLLKQKESFLDTNATSDFEIYQKLRDSSGGIAVTLMKNSSCSACGANIPSAIEQEVRSPGKLSHCPACKRILHPD